MRKVSVIILLLAVFALAGAAQLSRWGEQTLRQKEAIHAQIEEQSRFLASERAVWSNQAAKEALSFRPEDSEQQGLDWFLSPEGILFRSMSKAWDREQLRQLYEELLRNRHGPELNTLESVTVYAEEDEFAAAVHQKTVQLIPIAVHFPLFSDAPMLTLRQYGGQIALYGGDVKTTVESMAGELSHEYGHHYTLTYMLPGQGSYMDLQRDYARLRGLDPERTYYNSSDPQEYYDKHMNYLAEIAAEDYVVLMGSPNAMAVTGNYIDIRDYALGKTGDDRIFRNAAPQENMFLPFATRVPGLADYFYSFLDETAPEYPDAEGAAPRLIRKAVSYNLTSGYQTFVSYQITWDKVLGEDAIYTLVCLDPETEEILPLATVRSGETAEAEIGTITIQNGNSVNIYTDRVMEGTKRFLVVVTLPDGSVAVSDSVEQTF